MQHTPISITGLASISPLGSNRNAILKAYLDNKHYFTKRENTWVGELDKNTLQKIEDLKTESNKYKPLDNSVLFSILSSRNAIKEANWLTDSNFGVNIGSSRGATALFENHHEAFLQNNKAETLASPTTTLGNISSWVAHDLQTSGPEISHSITCSTALHALLNGIVWLKSGLTTQFLIGGTEAPLTPFTIAQMQALKIYAQDLKTEYPCKALDFNKTKNSMILSEASASLCLESGLQKNRLAQIIGIGYATEILQHHVSLSSTGDCFKKSMQMALEQANLDTIDIIVTHTPGTIKGDKSEYNAIKDTFKKIPFLTNNKWKIGHSLGASGVLSLEMAILMLTEQTTFSIPYYNQDQPKTIHTIMVNAVGFGGNAVSVIIKE